MIHRLGQVQEGGEYREGQLRQKNCRPPRFRRNSRTRHNKSPITAMAIAGGNPVAVVKTMASFAGGDPRLTTNSSRLKIHFLCFLQSVLFLSS